MSHTATSKALELLLLKCRDYLRGKLSINELSETAKSIDPSALDSTQINFVKRIANYSGDSILVQKIEKILDSIISENDDIFSIEGLEERSPSNGENYKEFNIPKINEISRRLQEITRKYKEGTASSDDVSEVAGYLMYKEFNPFTLREIIPERMFDFIEYLTEYSFNKRYVEKIEGYIREFADTGEVPNIPREFTETRTDTSGTSTLTK